MKKISFILSAVLLLILSGCASWNVPENTTETKIQNPTIACTSVAICDILDKLGYDNVIAVPETSTALPERYANLPTIGVPMTPDYEIIKSLSPDLVLSPKSLESALAEDYTNAGISSAFLDLSSVESMYKAITSLGNLLDRKAEAKKLTDDYESYMSTYTTPDLSEKSVLLLMTFPDGFYLVSTENSYVGNLVKLAGGRNVYDKDINSDENGFVNINPEDMVQKNPDMILVFAHYSEDDAFDYMTKEFAESASWQYYEAVKNGNIHYLPTKHFGMSSTLQWTSALDYLKPILHGE